MANISPKSSIVLIVLDKFNSCDIIWLITFLMQSSYCKNLYHLARLTGISQN